MCVGRVFAVVKRDFPPSPRKCKMKRSVFPSFWPVFRNWTFIFVHFPFFGQKSKKRSNVYFGLFLNKFIYPVNKISHVRSGLANDRRAYNRLCFYGNNESDSGYRSNSASPFVVHLPSKTGSTSGTTWLHGRSVINTATEGPEIIIGPTDGVAAAVTTTGGSPQYIVRVTFLKIQ